MLFYETVHSYFFGLAAGHFGFGPAKAYAEHGYVDAAARAQTKTQSGRAGTALEARRGRRRRYCPPQGRCPTRARNGHTGHEYARSDRLAARYAGSRYARPRYARHEHGLNQQQQHARHGCR